MFKYLLSIFVKPAIKPTIPGQEVYDKIVELMESGIEFKNTHNRYVRIDSHTYNFFVDIWGCHIISDYAYQGTSFSHKKLGFVAVKSKCPEQNSIKINNDYYRLCVFYENDYYPLKAKDAENLWIYKTKYYLRNKVSKMEKEYYVVDKEEYMTYRKYIDSNK